MLIISQQDWGTMFISKHHYAVELGKMGNNVYYLNGPDYNARTNKGAITITETGYEGVRAINHSFRFPYILKFKARPLYDFLLKFHIKRLLGKIDKQLDVVWSFDLSDTIPLKLFPASVKKIYMPVDELSQEMALRGAKGADVIISVTNEILEKFNSLPVPKVFLNHGVSEMFISNTVSDKINTPIQIGLSGNFLRRDIDRSTLLEIINENKNLVFNFWGSIDDKQSNINTKSDELTISFIEDLRKLSNVKLHGQKKPQELAKDLQQVDCFLICYDIEKDHSKGTNYHKILEYLATGKVVVSNNVTLYQKHPGLIEMPEERNNANLAALFKKVINNIANYNTIEKQMQRIEFAKQYTYTNQIKKIESYLN